MSLRKRHLAAVALAGGSTYKDAAKTAGVSLRQINRWAKEDDFKERVRRVQMRAYDRVGGQLARIVGKAMARVEWLMDNAATHAVQLAAAKELMDRAGRFREDVDIRKEIADIKSQLAEGDSGAKEEGRITGFGPLDDGRA
jgi:cytidylate kinase